SGEGLEELERGGGLGVPALKFFEPLAEVGGGAGLGGFGERGAGAGELFEAREDTGVEQLFDEHAEVGLELVMVFAAAELVGGADGADFQQGLESLADTAAAHVEGGGDVVSAERLFGGEDEAVDFAPGALETEGGGDLDPVGDDFAAEGGVVLGG